jgi:GTPase SAR1 family protein
MELFELLHYKIAYKLYFFFLNNNHPNLIIHGCNGSGKTTLIKTLLSHIYKSTIKKKETTDYSVHLNNRYYYFDCSSILNKRAFLDYFKEIILTYDYYHLQSKYIILDNFEFVGELLQNSLKVMIEKAYYTCKIIILTNRFNKVVTPIKSRCISMRIPLVNHYDKYIYLKEYLLEKKIFFNDFLLLDKCKRCDIHEIINESTITNYHNIETKIYQEMKKIIYWKVIDCEKIRKIRKLSSTSKELNITFSELLRKLVLECNVVDSNMIKECAENEYLLVNSYRSLIHIEHLLLNLNIMINR